MLGIVSGGAVAPPYMDMNHNFVASLLLPLVTATLSAQELKMEAIASPRAIEAAVTGAAPGSLVVLVLGMREAAVRLPGGLVLGVQPDVLTGFTIADDAAVKFSVPLLVESDPFVCFAQAVAADPRKALDEGSIALSQVRKIQVGRVTRLPR